MAKPDEIDPDVLDDADVEEEEDLELDDDLDLDLPEDDDEDLDEDLDATIDVVDDTEDAEESEEVAAEDEDEELDEEEEVLEEEEAEQSLDVLLAREKADEDLARLDEPDESIRTTTVGIGADEFTCRSCFLVKNRAQLADEDKLICFDCF